MRPQSAEEERICNDLFFFFSSRRRHTRSYGDWSSDVCSSDLEQSLLAWPRWPRECRWGAWPSQKRLLAPSCFLLPTRPHSRSEERRVGKSVELGGCGDPDKKIKPKAQ